LNIRRKKNGNHNIVLKSISMQILRIFGTRFGSKDFLLTPQLRWGIYAHTYAIQDHLYQETNKQTNKQKQSISQTIHETLKSHIFPTKREAENAEKFEPVKWG
jgi:hypothetical protein